MMRQFTDSEQNALARGRTELFDSLDKTESNYNLLLLNNTYREAFTVGLDHSAAQLAAITAERDSLRAALEEIAYRVKPRGLLARWLVERARGALNELTNQPTTTGEQG